MTLSLTLSLGCTLVVNTPGYDFDDIYMSVRARLDAEALELQVESDETDGDDDGDDLPPLEAPLVLPDIDQIEEEVIMRLDELELVEDEGQFITPKFCLTNPNESSIVTIDGTLQYPGTIGKLSF